MADLCCQYSFSSVVINNTNAAVNSLITDFDGGAIDGLDGKPIRKQIDPEGQSDGGIVHTALWGPRIVTFTGALAIVTIPDLSANPTAAWTAINVLEAATVSALESLVNSPTALTWTPTGGSAKSLTCTYGTEGGEIKFSGNVFDRKFSFTLVAANPTIS